MKKLFAVLLVSLFVSVSAFASGDHSEKEFVKGAGFDLVHTNHILVGTYNMIPIWAEKKCGEHIKGFYKKGEEVKNFIVSMQEIDGKSTVVGDFGDFKLKFDKLDHDNMIVILNPVGTCGEFPVQLAHEGVVEGHLQNPVWTFNNGEKEFEIKLQGEACFGSAIFYSLFFYGMSLI